MAKNNYKYEAGVQGYVNEEGYNSMSSDTTFQKRGYLEIKCEPDTIISKSSKSVSSQLAILAEIGKKGKIDERGEWVRTGNKFQESYVDIRYQSIEELSFKESRISKSHEEFHGKLQ